MYMNVITSTEIRTKMPQVIATLRSGESIDLIHRSKIIGLIKPQKYQGKPLTEKDIKELIGAAKKLKLPKLTDKQIEARYRKHLREKYGKGLS